MNGLRGVRLLSGEVFALCHFRLSLQVCKNGIECLQACKNVFNIYKFVKMYSIFTNL